MERLKLVDLNPVGMHYGMPLTFDCPRCRTHRVNLPMNGAFWNGAFWKLTRGHDFEDATINPSIQASCGAHFNIENGEIVWNPRLKLVDLNPVGMHYGMLLTFDCPRCRTHRVNLPMNGAFLNGAFWKLTRGHNFEDATINPSIQASCGAHFNIENGEIVWNP